jgi:hypothetical protein
VKGGGEPTVGELAAPVGSLPDSIALLRDTVLATGPELIVALGNVALRSLAAALTRPDDSPPGAARSLDAPLRLPGRTRLDRAGLQRAAAVPWPEAALPLDPGFSTAWLDAWSEPPRFHVLPLLHPSAQNMSPYAGTDTAFHQRMLQTRDALRAAARDCLGIDPPDPRPVPWDGTGIHALPEWQQRIGERHARLEALWRERGV